MARNLSRLDMELLIRMVPELETDTCLHSGHTFRSILPPVSQHFSRTGQEFRERLYKLDDTEVEYIADLILQGDESLGCMQDAHIDILLERVRKISQQTAEDIQELIGYIKEE